MPNGWGRRVRVEQQKCAVGQSPTAQSPTHVGLSSANPGDDGAANAEPTAGTGGYGRQSITWGTVAAPGSLDVSVDAKNSTAISWTSTAPWSTGATPLSHVSIWGHITTSTEAQYCGRAAIAVPQAVNAAGITLTLAANALVMGCNSV